MRGASIKALEAQAYLVPMENLRQAYVIRSCLIYFRITRHLSFVEGQCKIFNFDHQCSHRYWPLLFKPLKFL